MPQVRLYDTDASTVLAVYKLISGLTVTLNLRSPSTFRLEVPTQTPNALSLTKGRFIGLADVPNSTADTRLFRIDQVVRSVEADSLVLTGYDYSGIFRRRLIVPAAAQDYWAYSAVATETIAKGLVNYHAGPGAAAARQVPSLTLESDSARGPVMTVQARWQTLADLLEAVLIFGGAGYQVVRVGSNFQFQYLPGTSRVGTVFLTYDNQGASEQSWLQTDADRLTMLYVAGQGDLADRVIVERHEGGVEKTGLARFEGLVDARDLDNTTAMQQRGDEILAGMATENRYAATVHPNSSFKYGRDFWLGDIITLRNNLWGLVVGVRVISATLTWTDSDQPEVSVEFDRPWPTVKDKLVQDAHGTSTVAASGAVDYHPQYHAAQHGPSGTDPLVVTPITQAFTLTTANNAGYTTVTGSSVTLPKIGYWLIHLTIEWGWLAASDAGAAHGRLQLNGAASGVAMRDGMSALTNRQITQSRTFRVYASAVTDAVSAGIYDNSGGNTAFASASSGLVAQWVSN